MFLAELSAKGTDLQPWSTCSFKHFPKASLEKSMTKSSQIIPEFWLKNNGIYHVFVKKTKKHSITNACIS